MWKVIRNPKTYKSWWVVDFKKSGPLDWVFPNVLVSIDVVRSKTGKPSCFHHTWTAQSKANHLNRIQYWKHDSEGGYHA